MGSKTSNTGAIKQLEEELKDCVARAESEYQDPTTRQLGRLRFELIQECHKTLALIKRKDA